MIQSAVSAQTTGNGTVYIGSRVRGRIHAIKIVSDNTGDDNWDIAVTGETTGVPILVDATVTKNTTSWYYPRVLVSENTDGSAGTDAFADIYVLNERIKCVTTNTNGNIYTITVYYDSEE